MDLRQFNPMKILNHWETLNLILKDKNPPPVSCEIDPSNLCNHNCLWCMYRDFNQRNKFILPKKILFPLIDELAAGGVKSVTFTGGGEPLVNPLTVRALYEVCQKRMEVGLVTNGALMSKDVCRAIIDTCAFLRVSLDAACAHTHSILHRPKDPQRGGFKKILENLDFLISLKQRKKSSITIGIAFLVHPLNYKEIYQAARIAKDIGSAYIQFRPVYLPGHKPLEKIQSCVKKLMTKSLELNDASFHVFPILHRFDEITKLERTYKRCLSHALLGVVGADAKLYLCCQLRGDPRFSFGSLRKKTFFALWNSRKRQEVIRQIDLDSCPPCRYNTYNEFMNYLSDKERPHKNFL